MLNIYIGKEYIPKDKILIYDVEDYFGMVRIKDNLANREIIEKIELGSYVDEETFKDKFGRVLFADCLSTSSKILICQNQEADKYIFNASELGVNAQPLALKNSGNLFWKQINELPCAVGVSDDIRICVNGKCCSSLNEFMEKLEGLM